jgi:class 3 adenylate cyclase
VETLTFLFTDIEGSTALLRRVGNGVYAQVLAGHHALIRSALAAHDGREVDTQGDAFFAVFSSPRSPSHAHISATVAWSRRCAGTPEFVSTVWASVMAFGSPGRGQQRRQRAPRPRGSAA